MEAAEDANQFQLYSDSEICEVLCPKQQNFGYGDLDSKDYQEKKVGKT
jgi:hypothetical protein